MKTIFMLSFMVLALNVSAVAKVVEAPVDHVFVPNGFDSNDSVELVVTGKFPNTCYSRNTTKVQVKGSVIEVTVYALYSDDGEEFTYNCAAMIVPFSEVISVGNLQGGDYKVVVNKGSRYELTEGLEVKEARSQSADENYYAFVDYIEKKSKPSEIVLKAYRYSNCMEFDKVEVISNNKDTLSILPVMKKVSDFCPMKMMPMNIPVKLDLSSLKYKKMLLHVRTMEGKSVNSLVDLK